MQEQQQRLLALTKLLSVTLPVSEQEQPQVKQLLSQLKSGNLPAFSSCLSLDELHKTQQAYAHLKQFKTIVVLGVGGSSLGGQMLQSAMGKYAQADRAVFFVDNADPLSIQQLQQQLCLAETGFIAISKSGGTIETLLQSIHFIQLLEQNNLQVQKHFVAITEPKNAQLKMLFAPYQIPFYDHNPLIGGRYSVTSIVGLLPAMLMGFDVEAFIQGAGAELQAFYDAPYTHPSAEAVHLHTALQNQGFTELVMMPYGDSLRAFSQWFVQLWAESLGKQGKGTTPIVAVGSTDQHAQLQLFMDGPKNKFVTFIDVNTKNQGSTIQPAYAKRIEQPYLAGKTLGDLLACQRLGTEDALAQQNIPTRLIQIDAFNAESLGKLVMQMMLETVLTGYAWGVDPLDQPAVEDAKKRALNYLERMPCH